MHRAHHVVLLAIGLSAGWASPEQLEVADWGLTTGFQDCWENRYRKTRAVIAADFNRDGAVDYFVGNVDGGSYVLVNSRNKPNQPVSFEPITILPDDVVAFTAGSADYDNDCRFDLGHRAGRLPDLRRVFGSRDRVARA